MKWVVLFVALPVWAWCQEVQLKPVSPEETFDYALTAFLETDQSAAHTASLETHIAKLTERRNSINSDEAFLRLLFNRTHEKFLKHFDEYASFGEVLNKGNYNCLSATALYGLLLHHFEVPYDIIETNYHIFILVNTEKGQILFETTDPLNGFITGVKEIEKRIAKYKENTLREDDKNYYRLSCALYKHVNLHEITGLLHYNLAVEAYNRHDLAASIDHLDKATSIYCSPRMEELTRIVLLSVIESKQDDMFKEDCVRRIQIVRKRNLNALASR